MTKTSDLVALGLLGAVLYFGTGALKGIRSFFGAGTEGITVTTPGGVKQITTGSVITDVPLKTGYAIGELFPIGRVISDIMPISKEAELSQARAERAQELLRDVTAKSQMVAKEKAEMGKASIDAQIAQLRSAVEYEINLNNRDAEQGVPLSIRRIRLDRIDRYIKQINYLMGLKSIVETPSKDISAEVDSAFEKREPTIQVQTDKELEEQQNQLLRQLSLYADYTASGGNIRFRPVGGGVWEVVLSSDFDLVKRNPANQTLKFHEPIIYNFIQSGHVSPRSRITSATNINVPANTNVEIYHG